MSSINDFIRKELLSNYTMTTTLVKLEQLNIKDNEEIIRLLISDYYKIEFFESINKNNFTFEDSVDELINNFILNEDFLYNVVEKSKIYNKLTNISKIIIMEEIEKAKKDLMFIDLSKSHVLDKLSYKFIYNLECFKEYYKDYKTKIGNEEQTTDASIFIANKLIYYKKENYNKYKKFILEFIRIYFKWIIYVKNNFDKTYLYNEDHLYIEIIKHNSIDDLINYTEINYSFLVTIIENYLYYSTVQKDISGSIVEDYYINNVDSNIQKKLKRDI